MLNANVRYNGRMAVNAIHTLKAMPIRCVWRKQEIDSEEAHFLEEAENTPVDDLYTRVTRGQHTDISLGELDAAVFPYFEMLFKEDKSWGWKLKEFTEQNPNVPSRLLLMHLVQLNNLAMEMGAEPTHLLMVRTQQFKSELVTARLGSDDELDW